MNPHRLILPKASATTMAKWWCELNSWRWPEELGIPEEKSGEIMGDPRRAELMREITKKIGIKRCLEEWNKQL